MPSDDGAGQPSHDWGDIITKDGTIITHASTRITPSYQSNWIHFNMTTSTATNTYTGYADTSGQLGQIYDGTVYRVDNQIALYNNNGTTAELTRYQLPLVHLPGTIGRQMMHLILSDQLLILEMHLLLMIRLLYLRLQTKKHVITQH